MIDRRGWKVPRRTRFAGVGLVLGLVLTACGGGSGADGESGNGSGQVTVETGLVGVQEPAGEPIDGGTLDFAAWSLTDSLDPAEDSSFNGLSGGNVLSAIYGTLMRYNPETAEYEPQLAKSLEHNGDYTSWTLTLREGVQFSNGAALNAEAVKFSINRLIEHDTDLGVPLLTRFLERMATPDASTVVFELAEPWSSFPYVLATNPGMIVAPAAAEERGEEFATDPVGAGPFTLARFKLGEEIVLEANSDYWGGRPHLDRIRFVHVAGDQSKLDTLNTGGNDVAVLRKPDVVAAARQQGYGGFMAMQHAGGVLVANHQQGRPGSDRRVRKAIAHAAQPEVINQRAQDGSGLPGKKLFQQFSRWHTDVAATRHDPDKAKELLEQAKADGYDGQLQIMYLREDEDKALAWQAMLESVGFDVTLDGVRTNSERVRRWFVDTDYDVTLAGATATDAAPYPQVLSVWLGKQAGKHIAGYQDPKMARLVARFRAAGSDRAKREVMADIQRRLTETVPFVVTGAVRSFVAWDDDVHGVTPTLNFAVQLSDVWVDSR